MNKTETFSQAKWIVLALVACLATGLIGCTQTDTTQIKEEDPLDLADVPQLPNSEDNGETRSSICVSRPYFYDSEQALAADCNTIVVGTVLSQDDAYDMDPLIPDTRARVQIISTKKGSAMPEEEVVIRQTGDISLSILENGATYLFYLNDCPSKADETKQYYITGVTAGAFKLSGSTSSPAQRIRQNSSSIKFERVDKESGDILPDTLSFGAVTAESE